MGSIGVFFGIGLALAAHKFAVEADPKVEEVLETLAGAQCGGCGYPGCEAYAEAVVHDPDVSPTLCFPGKSEVAEAVAEITGKKMAAMADMIAAVRCSRDEGNVHKKYSYIGYGTCTGASLAFGGPEGCRFACVGFGECARACPFDAITVVNDFPVVDPDECVGCGACVRTCPKNIIELIPKEARVWVPCSTRDPGKMVRQLCEVGCISCKMCVKVCPAKAVSLDDNKVVIDHDKCMAYGPECGELCVEKCPRHIFRHYQARRETVEAQKAA
jgi:electron transport complex protein RnfB